MKSKNQERRDLTELLKLLRKLCPPKGSGYESLITLRRDTDGREILFTLTEAWEQPIEEILKESQGEHCIKALRSLFTLVLFAPPIFLLWSVAAAGRLADKVAWWIINNTKS